MAGLLGQAGLLLRPKSPDAAWLGPVRSRSTRRAARSRPTTLIGSPLYQAGLDAGDVILTLDGSPLTSDSVWQAVRAAHKPGDVIPLTYRGRGRQSTVNLTVGTDTRLEVVTYEEAGRPVTDAMQKFRQDWLAPRN